MRHYRGSFSDETQLFSLKAMRIQCLDAERNEIKGANGTGFIVINGDARYLYTCWHLVTGFGFRQIKVGLNHTTRSSLRVFVRTNDGRGTVSGGEIPFEIPLFSENDQGVPLWEQSPIVRPHSTINAANIAVPHSLDVVRIPLPSEMPLTSMQVIFADEFQEIERSMRVCEELFIVGYPYGYSALPETPSPIVLPRRVASDATFNRDLFSIIDRPCAPGMSGSPVFANRQGYACLVGVYSGLIYPDFGIDQNTPHTALGIVEDLYYHLKGQLCFVSAAVSAGQRGM